jgi:putative ABC transport system substrate-binding protein
MVLVLLFVPLGTEAQPQPGKVHRLGVLVPTTPPGPSEPWGAVLHLVAGLRELGYVEGQNLVVDRRYAEGKLDRLPGLARELVHLKVDAIFVISHSAILAARKATTTIPIVMFTGMSPDPVTAGFVASLARPGGNITGVLIAAESTLAGKRLGLIKEVVPRAKRIGILSRGDAGHQVKEVEKVASSLGVKLTVVDVQNDDYERAFARLATERPDALFVAASPFLFRDMRRIIPLAAKHRCRRSTTGASTRWRAVSWRMAAAWRNVHDERQPTSTGSSRARAPRSCRLSSRRSSNS